MADFSPNIIDEYARILNLTKLEVEKMLLSYLLEKGTALDLHTKIRAQTLKNAKKLEDIRLISERLEKLDLDLEKNTAFLKEVRQKYHEAQVKNQALMEERQQIEADLTLLRKENKIQNYKNDMELAEIKASKPGMKKIHLALSLFTVLGIIVAILLTFFKH